MMLHSSPVDFHDFSFTMMLFLCHDANAILFHFTLLLIRAICLVLRSTRPLMVPQIDGRTATEVRPQLVSIGTLAHLQLIFHVVTISPTSVV